MVDRVARNERIAYVQREPIVDRAKRIAKGHSRALTTPTDADEDSGRSGKQGRGSKSNRGRKAGIPNRVTTALKEAIILAAAAVGRDGSGKDGLTGYLVRLAKTEPRSFAALLGRVIPLHIVGSVDHKHRELRTADEVKKELAERGLPIDTIFNQDLGLWEPNEDDEAN